MFSKTILLVAISIFLSTNCAYASGNSWKIDPAHSNAHFSAKHMMVSNVTGDFSHISGKVDYDGTHLSQSTVEAIIDTQTIDTREPRRDQHLKGADFLNTAQFPTMTFKSKKIVELSGGNFQLVGDLTLHGVTKEVTLTVDALPKPIKDPHGNMRTGTQATTKINRKDFGINFNATLDNGGLVVGDDIPVTIDIELIQPS